ncbi:AEC family transporter [Agriterribacter sp.]|uniref:AEC family transporter n=1 Tax=Agriterribacter sp. TaxID=2821509 RepID=UPI002C4C3346|nr:AEC family transporter [Agriterribacter sp.]HRP57436.1 AEC family transporter [Agriterribacter sp.]
MANFLLIGICIVAGLLVRRFTAVPADAYKGVNALIINLALPAVAFKYLPHIQWTKSLILPAAMPVIVWLCGWVYVKAYAAKAKLDKRTENGLKLVTGLGNTSFLGFPLVIAWFGHDALGIAVICDQVTFTLLATAGIVVAMNASEKHSLSAGTVLKKMFSFPPFVGCVAALVLPLFINLSPLDPLFDMLAATVAPLALFSIGLQLKFDGWRRELKHLSASFLYKLVLAPLIILGIVHFLNMKGTIPEISIFESAMPSHLTATIVASEYNLNPKLTSLVAGIGIVISFVTTAVWYFIIKG